MSDQLVTHAATYTTHSKYKRLTFMPSARFETAILIFELPRTHTAAGLSSNEYF